MIAKPINTIIPFIYISLVFFYHYKKPENKAYRKDYLLGYIGTFMAFLVDSFVYDLGIIIFFIINIVFAGCIFIIKELLLSFVKSDNTED